MARKITAIPGLLAEAPNPSPAQEAPAARASSTRTTRREPEATVRSTLDLPTSRHAELLRAAVDAGVEVGWSVRPQHVLRAMFDELIDDPEAMDRVRERIRRQGRPTRRRPS